MKKNQLSETSKIKIRERRAKECFPICDRAVWFYGLTDAEKKDVIEWRNLWLKATETGICPARPSWIK